MGTKCNILSLKKGGGYPSWRLSTIRVFYYWVLKVSREADLTVCFPSSVTIYKNISFLDGTAAVSIPDSNTAGSPAWVLILPYSSPQSATAFSERRYLRLQWSRVYNKVTNSYKIEFINRGWRAILTPYVSFRILVLRKRLDGMRHTRHTTYPDNSH